MHHLLAIAGLCGAVLPAARTLPAGNEPTPHGSKPLRPVAAR